MAVHVRCKSLHILHLELDAVIAYIFNFNTLPGIPNRSRQLRISLAKYNSLFGGASPSSSLLSFHYHEGFLQNALLVLFYAYKLFTLYNCAFALFKLFFPKVDSQTRDSFLLALLMNITNYHVRSRNSFKNNIVFASDYWFNLLIHIFIRICRICFISVC